MKAPKKFYQGLVRFEPPDKKWMEYQYWTLDKSLTQIAIELVTTVRTVRLWMIALGIRRRNKQECAERHSKCMSGAGNPAWGGGTARNYQKRALQKSDIPYQCEWCGHTERLEVHHRDHDVANGDISNLAWMCRFCNMLEAQLWALQQNGRADVLIEDNKIEIHFGGK